MCRIVDGTDFGLAVTLLRNRLNIWDETGGNERMENIGQSLKELPKCHSTSNQSLPRSLPLVVDVEYVPYITLSNDDGKLLISHAAISSATTTHHSRYIALLDDSQNLHEYTATVSTNQLKPLLHW